MAHILWGDAADEPDALRRKTSRIGDTDASYPPGPHNRRMVSDHVSYLNDTPLEQVRYQGNPAQIRMLYRHRLSKTWYPWSTS
jgi:hypothetical protein